MSRKCRIWEGGINKRTGYGVAGKAPAHRVVYEQAHGPIPEGYVVMHTCDNRACVEPSHLTVGTQKENMEDCIAKGRIAKGERQGQARMTAAKVQDLRKAYDSGIPQTQLAAQFAISQPTVSQIVMRKTWRHV